MSYSFNPRLLFECSLCDVCFPNSDKLKEHKQANHFEECAKIKCIIFRETCLYDSFSTAESDAEAARRQDNQRNPHQISNPNLEFRNPCVSQEQANPVDGNGSERKQQISQGNHLLQVSVSRRDEESENTIGVEGSTMTSLMQNNEAGQSQIELPSQIEGSTRTSTFSIPDESQADTTFVYQNRAVIVDSVETSAEGSGPVQFPVNNVQHVVPNGNIQDSENGNGDSQVEDLVLSNMPMPILLPQTAGVSNEQRKTSERKSVDLRFPCRFENCTQMFRTSDAARHHRSSKHKNLDEMYSCSVCSKKFPFPSGLKRHLETKHSAKHSRTSKKLECRFCKKSLSSVRSRKRHEETYHHHEIELMNRVKNEYKRYQKELIIIN